MYCILGIKCKIAIVLRLVIKEWKLKDRYLDTKMGMIILFLKVYNGYFNHCVSPTDDRRKRWILFIIICGTLVALLGLVFWVPRNGKPWFVPHVTSIYVCKKTKVHVQVYHDMHI